MATFDVFDPAFRADPYPVYAWFREHDPVHRGRRPTPGDGDGGWWYLFSYADIADVLKDPRFGRAIAPSLDELPPPVPPNEQEPFWDMYARWTLALEPPDHTRQRRLLNRAFTGRVVEALRPFIETRASGLLHTLNQRDRFDIVADYAFPLTLSVIAELIGIPQRDLDRVKEWSLTIAAVLDYKPTWEIMAEGNRMTREFSAYLASIVAERRAHPSNGLLDRLFSAVEAKEGLDEEELISLCVMLLFAGHETTVNLISSGAYLLMTQPDQLMQFRSRLELTEPAVDEFLRLHSPIQATTRIAYSDVEIGKQQIKRGEAVTLLLGSANRDPAIFPQPERLDITRRPNRHLAFGRGIHHCLGAPLAVAQGGIALRLLIKSCPGWRIADDPLWSDTFGFRGLQTLPVKRGNRHDP